MQRTHEDGLGAKGECGMNDDSNDYNPGTFPAVCSLSDEAAEANGVGSDAPPKKCYSTSMEYVRIDLHDALRARAEKAEAERGRLQNAIHALLACPNIADRDPYPWSEPETEAAVSIARDALSKDGEGAR